MDWENKHFNQEIVLQAPVEAVAEAARRFCGQSLPDWTIDPTPEGFDASGNDGAKRSGRSTGVVMDAYGKNYLGVIREVSAQAVLVAYDEGEERWVPATAAHVVTRREDL